MRVRQRLAVVEQRLEKRLEVLHVQLPSLSASDRHLETRMVDQAVGHDLRLQHALHDVVGMALPRERRVSLPPPRRAHHAVLIFLVHRIHALLMGGTLTESGACRDSEDGGVEVGVFEHVVQAFRLVVLPPSSRRCRARGLLCLRVQHAAQQSFSFVQPRLSRTSTPREGVKGRQVDGGQRGHAQQGHQVQHLVHLRQRCLRAIAGDAYCNIHEAD